MKDFKFYGYSDDNLEVEGAIREEIPAEDCIASCELKSSEGALRVTGVYAPNNFAGTWCIGISPIDEDVDIPQWETRFALHEKGYSAELTITVPDDTVMVLPPWMTGADR